jgi:uncharacterized protein YggE
MVRGLGARAVRNKTVHSLVINKSALVGLKRRKNMNRIALPLGILVATVAPAHAAEVQIQSAGPVVELTVSEVVRSVPDVAQIAAGVQTRATTAREAVRQNAQQMDRLIARMKTLGIDSKDVQTSNFNLNAQYNYDQTKQEQVFAGYQVNNQVSVKLRDLDRAGEVLDALVAAGANNIYGPNFMLEDDMEAKSVARANAFKRGRQMAEQYAAMAGMSGVRLLEVSESFQSYGPVPESAIMVTASRASSDASTPIEPGEVGTGATITVKYEMQ